jgi:hypothetical protein
MRYLAAVAVLGCVLTGCSGGQPALDTSGPGAAKITDIVPTKGQILTGSKIADRVRQAMARAGSARFTLASSTTSGQDAEGSLNLAGGQIKVSFDFKAGDDQLRVISLPGVLYADVGQVVGGRHWLKVTAGATDPVSTTMAPLLSYMTNSADISSQTSSWGAAGGFTIVDVTTLAGVPVTEYDATIPQSAVQAGLPAQFRDVMKQDVTGDSKVQLWLDGLGRPYKVVTTGNYAHKEDLVTVMYSDWGKAPLVTAPPATDVIVGR